MAAMNERKVALITGGRRGIGAGIARALADSGFDLALVDLELDRDAEATLTSVMDRGARATFLCSDIAELATHEELLDQVYAWYGRLDCLINNAGVMSVRGDMLEATPEDFDRVIGTNLRGTFFLTQAVARRMVDDAPRWSGRSIITITSANAVMVSPEKSPYCISKSALSMAVQLFAVRLAEHGISAFEVRPGLIKSPMSGEVEERFTRMIESGVTPIRRWGEPADVGRAVATIATGGLPYSVGQPINVDGGLLVFRL
jgi:NAD(P)-dependent dehydrogenase (short-subunit alcohol dehydrogenase family)